MSSHDAVLASHQARIQRLVARFQGHNGFDRALLLHWLGQFALEDIELALRVLENVIYFTRTNIRGLAEQMVDLTFAHLDAVPDEKVLFVFAGDIWESDALVARIVRYDRRVPERQLAQYTELASLDPGDWQAVVVLKDFAGTGQQLADWWDSAEPLILPLEVEVVLGVLVLNGAAMERLERLGPSILVVRQLNDGNNVFHDECTRFSEGEKEIILRYCRRTAASDEYLRGRGANGLLVAFDHFCPNNSLPVLWHGSGSWTALFGRHALQ